MRTWFPLLAVATLLCGQIGCAPRTKAGSTATVVGGVMLAAAGGLVLADLNSPGNDTNGNGRDDFPENEIACAFGGCAIGALMLATGAVLAIIGYASYDGAAEANSGPDLTPSSPAAAPSNGVDMRMVLPLPEHPVDAETLQLAKQARSATRQGDCYTARYIFKQIVDRDVHYAAALIESPALARCRAQL